MNFDFSEQQKLIQSEARKFLREQCPPERMRQVMEQDAAFDDDLWSRIRDLGWMGLAIPEQYGGLGLGYLELCVIAQELGRALAPIPFSSNVYLFNQALVIAGNEAQKQRWLPRVAGGELVACTAVAERVGDQPNSLPVTEITQDGRLHGQKIAVVDGMRAEVALVSARSSKGEVILCLLELDQAGCERAATESLDLSRPLATLTLNDVKAEPLAHCTAQTLTELYNTAAVLFAFEQVGGCEAALKMGMSYTKQRYAFGRPVATFQAIKHKFADMYVAKEIALSNAYYGAWALASSAPELSLAAATARVSANQAYFECSRENLQAHGGMGYTWEFDCHLHYRRAQHLSLVLGGTPYWKERINTELLRAE